MRDHRLQVGGFSISCYESTPYSLKRRARLLVSNGSIPREIRSLIRCALEIKDPYLAQIVRRVEDGEMTIEWLSGTQDTDFH